MKKVYTITFHNADNYGAVIQAYALQKVLEKKYETKILDYDNKTISEGYKLFKKTKGGIKTQLVQFLKDIINLKKNYLRIRNFNNYRKKINFTKKYSNYNEVLNNYPKVDAFVVGSDQVWNKDITGFIDPVYTLNFGKNDFRKISYAASSGDVSVIEKDTNILNYISKIDKISVREKSLSDYLTKKIDNDVSLVLDPSLLLTKKEWLSSVENKRIIKEKYIFVYCGNEPDYFYKIIEDIQEKTGYLVIHFGRRDKKIKCRKKSVYSVGPAEFISLINNAECVVTTSFHAVALSVICNKKLYAVLNRYSDRLETTLTSLGLSDCIIHNYLEYEEKSQKNINWDKSNELLDKKREESINWLYSAIDK